MVQTGDYLIQSETSEIFQSLFNVIEDYLFVVSSSGKILDANQAVIQNLGYSDKELLNMDILLLYPPEWREEATKLVLDMLEGKVHKGLIPLYTKDERYIPVETRICRGKWKGQDIAFGICRDITEKSAIKEQLQESEARYEAIVNNAPELIIIHSKGKIIFINQAALKSFGYSKTEIIGHSVLKFLTESSKQKVATAIDRKIQGENVGDYDIELRLKSGELRSFMLKTTQITYEGNQATLVVLVDVTERKRVEAELNKKETILSALAMSIKELLDNRDYYQAVSRCFAMLGKTFDVDRVYLFQNQLDQDELETTSQRIEWNSGVSEPQINNPELQAIFFQDIESFIRPLIRGQSFFGIVDQIENDKVRADLQSQHILSILVLPLFIKNKFWGFIGLDECRTERSWTNSEISGLSAFVNALEKAIERSLIENELEIAKHDAEKANCLKSQFLANMSHEIRTPMNAVIGFVRLLAESGLTGVQHEYLREIRKSSDTLIHLLNDILDYSKIEADRIELEQISFNIHMLVEDTVSLFAPKAYEKGVKINYFINPHVPKILKGDPVRLRQVMNNLVGNAVKFTESGVVNVQLNLKANYEMSAKIELKISDTGIGMSKEVLSKLFTVFTQGDVSTTRKYGGSGLGLAISYRLIKLMSGEIRVESGLGQGATFDVELELEKGEIDAKSSFCAVHSHFDTIINRERKYDILSVEDNSSSQKLIGLFLKKIGYNVMSASNGKQAATMCNNQKYDLILMDCMMPVMDGFEAAMEIKQNSEKNKDTVIIAMTANAMEGDRENCIAAGMDDYLSKPINMNHLEGMIRKWLKF